MAKPVILTVDNDPWVLRAVERDLRRLSARDDCMSATVSSATVSSADLTLACGSYLSGMISSISAGRMLVEPGETRFTVRLPADTGPENGG